MALSTWSVCLVSHSRARRLLQLAQYAATGAGMAPSVLHRTGNGTDGVALPLDFAADAHESRMLRGAMDSYTVRARPGAVKRPSCFP